MKTLLIATLMLLCISCDKNETSEPDFHQTYWMEYTANDLKREELVKVNLSLVNRILTISFQIDETVTTWTYTGEEVYCPNDFTISVNKTIDGSNHYHNGVFYRGHWANRSYFVVVNNGTTIELREL